MRKAQGTNVNRLFRDSLRRLLSERGIKQKKLADDLSYKDTTVSHWCTGKTTPSMQAVATIADYLNVPVAAMFSEGTYHTESYVYRMKVPVESKDGLTFVDEYQLSDAPGKKADFAILAPDDSMAPCIQRNDVILCRSTISAQNGGLVVVVLDGKQTVRRLFANAGFIILLADNPAVAPVIVNVDMAPDIIGKPILIQRPL